MILGEASALYSGYNERERYWQTRRSEVARAFTEFRNSNPNASYQDFRAYIDNLTEGNSYLRGAVPSDQLLQTIVTDNQRKLAQEQMQQRLQMMRQQADLAGSLEAMAGNYALQFDNDAQIEDAIVGSFGGDESTREMIRKTFPNGFAGIRQRTMMDQTLKNLPVITEILRQTPDADISALFPGAPKSLISSYRDAARKKLEEESLRKNRELETQELSRMKNRLDLGVYDYEVPDDITDPNVRSRLSNIWSSMVAEAERKKSESEARNRANLLEGLTSALKSDPGFMNAIRTNDQIAALNMLNDRAKTMGLDEIRIDESLRIYKDFESDVEATLAEQFDSTKMAMDKSIGERMGAQQQNTISAMEMMFGADAPLEKRVDLKAAITMLAGSNYISPVSLSAIIRKYGAGDATSDPAGLALAIQNDPEIGLVPISEERDMLRRSAAATSGLPEKRTDFRSWANDYEQSTQTIVTKASGVVAETIKKVNDATLPLQSRVSILEQTKAKLLREQSIYVDEITAAGESSNIWLKTGSGPFDENVAAELFEKRISALADQIRLLDAEEAKLRAFVAPPVQPKKEWQNVEEEAWRQLQSLPTEPQTPRAPPPMPEGLGPTEQDAWRQLWSQ